jgi:hypothetical protein
MRSSIGSSQGPSPSPSKDGRKGEESDTGDQDITALAEPVLQVPHPTPIHNETVENAEFDFGFEGNGKSPINHNDDEGKKSAERSANLELDRLVKTTRPRSPVLESVDIDRICSPEAHKFQANRHNQHESPSASEPTKSTATLQLTCQETSRPKSSAGRGKGESGSRFKRPGANRRFTLGGWTTEKSSSNGHNNSSSEGKRLRYSMLIRAV